MSKQFTHFVGKGRIFLTDVGTISGTVRIQEYIYMKISGTVSTFKAVLTGGQTGSGSLVVPPPSENTDYPNFKGYADIEDTRYYLSGWAKEGVSGKNDYININFNGKSKLNIQTMDGGAAYEN